ncbi:AraC family transcriptional regulator [Pectobacterium sp. B1J-3]|uniref:AraC family transcriptional regulator n=1 Tax=Pectobacterium sp. B1J-3 TaxID=3385371 RepID=UPI0039064D1E
MLDFTIKVPIKVQNGGLFISRGVGMHPQRMLDSWELIFVEKGTLTLKENEHVFQVKSGESLLLWPKRKHVGVGDFPADLKFYWLHFEVIYSDIKMTNDNNMDYPAEILSIPQHVKIQDTQYIISLFRQFLSEQENVLRSVALELILLLILQQIASAASHKQTLEEAGIALAYKAQQLIRTQYHQAIATSVLAEQLHCNADYLGRVYRRTFHITMTEAIHRQRILAAEKWLITDSCSVTEVATRCGFSDVGYFRQIFRRLTGLTPAAWKQRYCKEHINSD